MKNADTYNFQKASSDTDLRRFTLVLALYLFNPCSSVASVVTELFDNCRESSTNRPPFMQNKANFRKAKKRVYLFVLQRIRTKLTCGQSERPKPILRRFDGAHRRLSSEPAEGNRFLCSSHAGVLDFCRAGVFLGCDGRTIGRADGQRC